MRNVEPPKLEWDGDVTTDTRFILIHSNARGEGVIWWLHCAAADKAVALRYGIGTNDTGPGAKARLRKVAQAIADAAFDARGFKLPTHLYCLAWWNGRGYPVCIERTFKSRIYYEAAYALRTLTEILSMPTHHLLVGAWELVIDEDGAWHELPESWLPTPDDIAAARAKRQLVALETDPSLGPAPFGEGSDDA